MARETQRGLLGAGWKVLTARGIIGVIFGVVAIVWPASTALALTILWGFWALAEGLGISVEAARSELFSPAGRLGLTLLGLLGIIAAFFAIFSPHVTAKTVTWILGIWLIVRGVLEMTAVFGSRLRTSRWMLVPGAALSVLLGLFFVLNPGRAAVGIAVLLGTIALAWGLVYLAAGQMARRELAARTTGGVPNPQPEK
ncbi:DUF308 domain-containing protein [Kribbella sp. NPDC026611]|uniref:HdeD family acid-resistance protein n=1 Tax=Kribbella sp. NPDC026611 TaxID=3154911 RepID=UPI0033FD2C58